MQLLCISTRELVLYTSFAGQNYLFQHFNIFFCHKWEKEKDKNAKKDKNTWKKGVYQCLGAISKCW